MKIKIMELKNRKKGAHCPYCKSRLTYNLEWTGSMWPDFLPAHKNYVLHCSECSNCRIFFISPKDVPKGAEAITHTTLGEDYIQSKTHPSKGLIRFPDAESNWWIWGSAPGYEIKLEWVLGYFSLSINCRVAPHRFSGVLFIQSQGIECSAGQK